MKKTFKKVTSIIMAALVSLSPMSGFIVPMTVHAAETNIALADCTYDEEGTAIVLKSYSGSANKVNETSLVEEIQKTKPTITDVEIGSEFWSAFSGDLVVGQGVKLHGKPALSTTVTSIKFDGNNELDGVTMKDFFIETFKDWTSLRSVDGLGNILKSASTTDTTDAIVLDKTFSGCTSLVDFDLDMTSSNNWVSFSETFSGCTSLGKIDVKSAHIVEITRLNQSTSSCPDTLKFSMTDCTLADKKPLVYAFGDMAGTFTFQNCNSVAGDGISMYKAFTAIDNPAYSTTALKNKNVDIILENTKVNSVECLMQQDHGNVDVSNLVTADTKNIDFVFGGSYKNIKGISTWDTSGVTSLTEPLISFRGTTQSTTDSVITAFKNLNLSNITLYKNVTFGTEDGINDLSGAVLSSSSDAKFIISSLNDYLVTPKTFGGKYYVKVKLYAIDSKTGEYTEVPADSTGEYEGTTYQIYNSSTLKPETKYSSITSVLEIIDVADKNKAHTTKYFTPGTVVIDVLDSSTHYFTDEDLKTPLTRSTVTSKDDFTRVYFTSDTGSTPEPVIDAPTGAKVEFSKSTAGITATLSDGSTMPLVQAGYTTTITINTDTVPSSYGKVTGMDKFKGLEFYDITITINDGTKTHVVKSLDADVAIYLPKPTDFDAEKDFKVYHYNDGISKKPEELTATFTKDNLIKVLTNSFSPYAVAYNGDAAVAKVTKEIKLTWDDSGKEDNRPSSVVVDYVAKYADGTEKTYNVVFDKDTSSATQTKNIEVPEKEGTANLTGVTASVRNVTYYSISKDASSDLAFKLKYTGNTAQIITSTFEVEFENDTAQARPASVELEVYCTYEDDTRETKTVTVNVGSTGTGSVDVQFPIKNEAGSQYRSIRWTWPNIANYDLVGTGRVATYRYTGSTPATVQTEYTLTVKFSDTTDKTKRPSELPITWTATTERGAVTTGTASVMVNTTSDTFTTNVTVPAATNDKRTVVFTAPAVNGYGLQTAGTTFTYTLTAASTSANVEIIFEDENNKAGRRPDKIEFTLKDSSNESNTVTGSVSIPNNTTTDTKSYTTVVNIPAGTTYAIKEVKNLPNGYTASYSGLSVTLKYTPETVSKTYSVKFEGDAESVRPSSVTITVKSGDTTGSTLTVSKDTNWSATATLAKYIKGVEAAWTPSVANVNNYSASVSGETITLKYTGTLTEAQKQEAAKAAGTDVDAAKGETENDLYNYDKFDWIDYANRYPDVKKAFGYNKEQLYAHYIHYGIAEGRVATFTGKYENVNEEILAAYFPDDYKYRVSVSDPLADMANGTGSTVSGNSTSVSTDGSGNTVIKKDNGDGTTTETVVDKDGNVVSTRTYTTGDFRTEALTWLYVAIALVALAIGGVYYYDFDKKRKTSKFIETTIKS